MGRSCQSHLIFVTLFVCLMGCDSIPGDPLDTGDGGQPDPIPKIPDPNTSARERLTGLELFSKLGTAENWTLLDGDNILGSLKDRIITSDCISIKHKDKNFIGTDYQIILIHPDESQTIAESFFSLNEATFCLVDDGFYQVGIKSTNTSEVTNLFSVLKIEDLDFETQKAIAVKFALDPFLWVVKGEVGDGAYFFSVQLDPIPTFENYCIVAKHPFKYGDDFGITFRFIAPDGVTTTPPDSSPGYIFMCSDQSGTYKIVADIEVDDQLETVEVFTFQKNYTINQQNYRYDSGTYITSGDFLYPFSATLVVRDSSREYANDLEDKINYIAAFKYPLYDSSPEDIGSTPDSSPPPDTTEENLYTVLMKYNVKKYSGDPCLSSSNGDKLVLCQVPKYVSESKLNLLFLEYPTCEWTQLNPKAWEVDCTLSQCGSAGPYQCEPTFYNGSVQAPPVRTYYVKSCKNVYKTQSYTCTWNP